MKIVSCLASVSLLVTSGCSSMYNGMVTGLDHYTSNKPEFDQDKVKAFTDNQNAVLKDFARLAGVVEPQEGGEWRQVVDAGIFYTNTRCQNFIQALFIFERVRSTTSRQIGYTGAAVGAALAVVEASKTAIGLTPLGFSLLDQTVNNVSSGILFNLKPATVKELVQKKQKAYVQGLSASYTSRMIAFQAIQGYADICLPASIETEVERAISAREYEAQQVLPIPAPNLSDVVPDSFNFTDVPDAAPGVLVESAEITASGFGSNARISVSTGGQYGINGGSLVSTPGTIAPGSSVRVAVTSSTEAGKAAGATLNIGGVTDTFNVTTRTAVSDSVDPTAAPAAPAAGDDPLPTAQTVTINPTTNALPSPEPKP